MPRPRRSLLPVVSLLVAAAGAPATARATCADQDQYVARGFSADGKKVLFERELSNACAPGFGYRGLVVVPAAPPHVPEELATFRVEEGDDGRPRVLLSEARGRRVIEDLQRELRLSPGRAFALSPEGRHALLDELELRYEEQLAPRAFEGDPAAPAVEMRLELQRGKRRVQIWRAAPPASALNPGTTPEEARLTSAVRSPDGQTLAFTVAWRPGPFVLTLAEAARAADAQGRQLVRLHRFDDALAAFEAAADLDRRQPHAAYNAACAAARLGDVERAVAFLRRFGAAHPGYALGARLDADADFERVRSAPAFLALRAELGGAAAAPPAPGGR